MESPMRRTSALLLAASLIGCSDTTAPADDQDVTPPISAASVFRGNYQTQAVMTCNVVVADRTVTCTSPQDPNPLAEPVIGGRGMHARLRASNARYVSDSAVFRFRMTVQNLLPQTIGATQSSFTGMAVFLFDIATTAGNGTVTVNPAGYDEFTAPDQPYYDYTRKLEMGAESLFRNWSFNVPATVNAFRFRAYVSADILPLVVFDMEVAGNRDIYAASIDGSGLRRLTTNDAVDMTPVAARERVVFVSYRDGNAELYAVSLVDGTETRLTNTPANETEPALLPNNSLLAYVTDASGVPRVVTAGANGGGAMPLPATGHGAAVEAAPTFLADGDQVVYVTTGGNTAELYRATRSLGTTGRLLGGSAQRMEPRSSPDGSKVAFVTASMETTNPEIWIYDVATATTTRFTKRRWPDMQPTFLHDGRVAWLYGTSAGSFLLRSDAIGGGMAQNMSLPALPAHPYGVPLRP